jgi:hypothetical protein
MRRKGKKLAQVARLWALDQLHTPTQKAQSATHYDETLAALGLRLDADDDDSDTEPPPEDKCYLWPCNMRTWQVWQGVQTQWRTSSGMDGMHRSGLDYTAVAAYLQQVARIRPGRQWSEVWAGIQAMEIAALNAWAEKHN